MKNELFTDLPQRIEEDYPEMENEMLLELRKKDEAYEELHEQFYDIQGQYPFIMEVLEGKGSVALTAEEHEILLNYLALYREMDEKERIHVYFRGHTDALAYLKKTGMV
ncbi:DUF6664 family protein [Pseudoramibacter alactolyticus]|jgi:hypothetical protein|uniref:DUF6664 family protein n=1 Tax=Pseudoramibacter alactolyticus TaxID=113287 RepID=UPI0028F04790|nr:hypothetical protein [Pseudoramibacter alactolyticus]